MTSDGSPELRCAFHPSEPARTTCDRCGSFICATCLGDAPAGLCTNCRSHRFSFPLTREAWSFDGLVSFAWERFQQQWVMLSVVALIVFVAGIVINSVGQSFLVALVALGNAHQLEERFAIQGAFSLVLSLIVFVVQGAMQLGVYQIAFDVLRGGAVDLGQFLRQGRKVLRYLVVVLLTILLVVVPLFLLIVLGIGLAAAAGGARSEMLGRAITFTMLPFVVLGLPLLWMMLPLGWVLPELAAQEVGPVQALVNAFAIGRGHRLGMLLVLLLGTAAVFVGFLFCCIGAIPALGFTHMLIGGQYLALRNGVVVGATPSTWSADVPKQR